MQGGGCPLHIIAGEMIMATIISNRLTGQYEKAVAAYEELVSSATPYLLAQALDRISEEERDELYCMLEEVRELEGVQRALLENLLPALREEIARLRASEDSEDDWLDMKLKIMDAESELHEMTKRL
jgi:hypothetical protein